VLNFRFFIGHCYSHFLYLQSNNHESKPKTTMKMSQQLRSFGFILLTCLFLAGTTLSACGTKKAEEQTQESSEQPAEESHEHPADSTEHPAGEHPEGGEHPTDSTSGS
jgi:hypothetical protein